VAELTLGLMIALARDIKRGDRALHAGGWARLGGPELRGKTLGIVGLGRVGKSVALLARAFGMQILACDVALAALDVFEAEPSISAELRELPNVILTPHTGGSADEALARMMELALLNVTQVLDGAEPVCRVN
jgi:phosphoglycerate dehydrogenase-like enzyme